MPLNPKSQAKLGAIERQLLVELEPIGSNPQQKNQILAIERHLMGLIAALKNLDSKLEARIIAGIRQYVGDYSKGEKKKVQMSEEKPATERKKKD